MKRAKLLTLLLSAIVLLGLISCEKDEKDNTTYEIINNTEHYESSMDYLDGTLWEVVVYHFIGDDVAKQENLDPIAYGGSSSGKIEIDNNIEKIKVSYKLLPRESQYYDLSANDRIYVVAYKYIKEGENNKIEIDGETMVNGSLKSAKVNQQHLNNEQTFGVAFKNFNVVNKSP